MSKPPSELRIQIDGGITYGLTLSVAEFAALFGQNPTSVYVAAAAGTTAVPVIKLSGARIAFSTAAAFRVLGIPFEIVSDELVGAR